MSENHSTASSINKVDVEHQEDSLDLRVQNDLEALDKHEISLVQVLRNHPVPKFNRNSVKLYLMCMALYLCSTMNGYDGSLMTGINTLPEYREHFNLKESPASTGLTFSIYPIGAMCATVFVPTSDVLGRIPGIAIGLIILIVGAIISATTNDFNTWIGARFLLSFGNCLATTTAPMYLQESIRPDMKVMALFYNTFYYIGSIIATFTLYGTKIHYTGHKTFSLALWFQLLCPGIVLSLLYFFPESPRYLYSKGKVEKCKEFIVKYHADGDENHPIVNAELFQIRESFEQGGYSKLKDYFDYTPFFRTKASRRRALLVVIWSWFCQYSGNQVITYYMTTLFENLGVTNAITRLLLTAVNSIVCLFCALGGVLTVENLGRRPILIYANIGFIISFSVLAGSTKAFHDDPDNKTAAQVGIAFIYIFQAVFFSFAFTPLQPSYPSEILDNSTRARGMGLWHLVSNAASTLNLYTAPLAMEKIKYWYYVFFVFWDFFQLVVIYFTFVETSRLSLEEIEYVFQSPKPVKESIRLSKAARSGHRSIIKETLTLFHAPKEID